MGRIRSIKPEFFQHEGLYDLEEETQLPIRVAFAGLWTQCDREGRFEWRPRQLGVNVLPYDGIDFSRVLDALATRGFVVRYRVDGKDYGFVPTWTKHQVINNRERKSDLPKPEEKLLIRQSDSDASTSRHERDDYACATRDAREAHGALQEGKGKEGNKERKESDSVNVTDEFESWWQDVPRKVSKGQAEKAFRAARKKADLETLTAGIRRYAEQVRGTEPKYIKHPATWLNGECWLDEHPPPNGHDGDGAEGQRDLPMTTEEYCSRIPDDAWRKYLEFFRKTGQWMDWLGPRPDSGRCLCPEELMREAGLIGDGEAA